MRSSLLALAVALALLAPGAVAGAANPPSAAETSAGGLARLVAPPRACGGQFATGATSAQQERTMLCMTNYARRRSGKRPMRPAGLLFRSAALKSRDIIRCDSFDHTACGRPFSFWMRQVGYLKGGCWRAAENIAYGTGPYASARSIFRGWIRSPGHRANILGPAREIGIGLRVGGLEGVAGAHVWTQHFGTRC